MDIPTLSIKAPQVIIIGYHHRPAQNVSARISGRGETLMAVKFVAYMFAFYDEHPRVNPDGKSLPIMADGEVWYRIVDGERAHHFLQQFRKGNLTKENEYNIWSWDGDRENPTIRPSLLVPDYHFHCYVTQGRIDVLPDSQVENVAKRMTWDEFTKGD